MATEATMQKPITITVVYSAQARAVQEFSLAVETGSRIEEILPEVATRLGFTSEQLGDLGTGIWGKRVPVSHLLRDGNRLELYRPLTVDPKVARRERFVRQGAKSAGLFAKRRTGAKAGY